ncbi:MAG TPA: hypothetical protein PK530_17530 [Anaerolineales bacterium]|nr:hypothetical protein [Anaerolineales bacterium]
MPKKQEPPLLQFLEDLYEKERKKIPPVYPVNPETGKIELPHKVIAELRHLVRAGNKPAAMKHLCNLTGVGLRAAKDFVDGLA